MDKVTGIVITLYSISPVLSIFIYIFIIVYTKALTKKAKYFYRTNLSYLSQIYAIFFVLLCFLSGCLLFLHFDLREKPNNDAFVLILLPAITFFLYLTVFSIFAYGSCRVYAIDVSNILHCYSLFKKKKFDLNKPFDLNVNLEEYNATINPLRINKKRYIKQGNATFKLFACLYPNAVFNTQFVEYLFSIKKGDNVINKKDCNSIKLNKEEIKQKIKQLEKEIDV